MKTDKQLAADFAKQWKGKGDEKQETQRFWIQLLSEVLGVTDATNRIEFEKRVQLSHTSFIDAYIPETKVLIEQKSADINLHKQYRQSDGEMLTPYGQAKRYVSEMKASEKPRWIVVCNFQEFLVYDLEKPGEEPEQIFLKRLGDEYYRLQFLVDQKSDNIRKEEELSREAGVLVGKLYDALLKEYINPDEDSFRSLNILCVRIVFCLYAEDAELFETRTAFEDYISSFPVENVRDGIIKLFKALDTKKKDRDKYDTKLNPFPYVNGGLFAAENIEIPNFTEEIVDVIVNHCAPFNWSEISPTIFGAVFESTLNPDTRRKGGMHYTSVADIHKVINPLFMDSLYDEYDEICRITTAKARNKRFLDFQKKLGSLTFLDPACGSGNFLTETYLSLHKLENEAIVVSERLKPGERLLNLNGVVKVSIGQFNG
ncbi:MAG: methylase, partial [Paludibacteraceae bacterium]|nr:methylase [Paludibacteraceae bacterium]